jgi:hypothetical protein
MIEGKAKYYLGFQVALYVALTIELMDNIVL